MPTTIWGMTTYTLKGCGGTTPTTPRAVPPLLELLAVANAMASSLRLGAGAVASATRPTVLLQQPSGIVPWVSLGASAALFAAHVETGNDVATEGSDRGWGYEAGAGVLVPLGGPFLVNPGVRYGRSDSDFAARRTLETRYIIADIGLVLAF